MIQQVIVEEKNNIKLSAGEVHRWSKQSRRKYVFECPLILQAPKLLAMLATGVSFRFAYTGLEDVLVEEISHFPVRSLYPHDIFRMSYRLNKGNLYLMTSAQYIFRINIATKVATHLGTIKGLPAGFSINGMAVTDKNQILVTSAVQPGYFLIDAANWTAAAWPVKETSWNGSDLANGNVLRSQANTANAKPETPQLLETGKGSMSIYPNPILNNQFQLRLRDLIPGGYQLEITDMLGRLVLNQAVQILEVDQDRSDLYNRLLKIKNEAKELKNPMLVGIMLEDEFYNSVMKLIVNRMSINA
jgi:hypothetical protein